ncbi:Daunorubicin/doxorubicin resistance ATP-binding protein DrrA [Suttonella ornithocola]|uniref:Daunorubicin/doxorubicin resistance ATP-binding protein DrrA n=2 Tax=Suttonella ornithocola TaxID=279832 RepID=A0A380MRE4_9GAMM|nr:Daunorubicin/doxorubicin resistance ATP-binding protein DrrA [Suttonella ornithocola]
MTSNPPALELIGVEKTYSNGFHAVKGIDLQVAPGDFYALLGPNGAGKSTTIGVITSLVKKTAGTIRIFGVDIDKNFSEAKKAIGLVPQEFNFNIFETAYNIVRNQAGFYNLSRAQANERALYYLDKLGLLSKKDVQARALSGGMKRRLMIARAMAHEPKLLILDEPTAGVDLEIRLSMWEFLKEINANGTTIILTTHYLEEAESLCRNVGIVNHGEIVHQSSMKSLLAQADEEAFVLDIEPITVDSAHITGFTVVQKDESTLEVLVPKSKGLSQLFLALNAQGVNVLSLRNKMNRLEALFLKYVGSKSP